MKFMTGMRYVRRWIPAERRLLAAAWSLLKALVADPDRQDVECALRAPARNEQMLLPGIAEPRRWEFGRADRERCC